MMQLIIIFCFGVIFGIFISFLLFQNLSTNISIRGNKSFIDLAHTGLLFPIKESLNQMNEYMRFLEKTREGAYQALYTEIRLLKKETENLSKSFHSPLSRGRWGEIQLKRVVELSGMLAHCDFGEQITVATEGEIIRPDLIIKLPGNRCIIVDAKVPFAAYLKATDENNSFIHHAEQVKKHIQQLGKKNYWKHFQSSPEFVILFLPGEAFLSTALQHCSELIEIATKYNIILATPITLIATLRAIAYSWRHEALNRNSIQIIQKSKEIYDRIGIFADHFEKIGKNLQGAIESYNQAVLSFESKVLVSIRQIGELGELESIKTIKNLNYIDKTTKTLDV